MPIRTTTPAATARTRAMTALFAGSALMNAAMATASAVGTIVAAGRLGAGWGGVPPTAGIVGTGVGAVALTNLMRHRGRRTGLLLGYACAALGGVLTVAGTSASGAGTIVPIGVGMLLLGFGNAGAQLSRYASAELYPAARRGFAISTIVWAGALGAVGGPLLLGVTSDAAGRLGWDSLAGPFAFAAVAGAGAFAATALGASNAIPDPSTSRVSLRAALHLPSATSALAVMATAQVVMVAVMTSAPLEMHQHGSNLQSVGWMLSAHTLGMFAFSPLTGRLLDSFGARPLMRGGLIMLAVSTGLAAGGGRAVMTPTLFLLGYAWNLCFIGGSGHLVSEVPAAERAGLEGAVDGAVWGAAALASLTSTALLGQLGYGWLSGLAGLLVLLPAALLAREGKVRERRPPQELLSPSPRIG